MLPRPTAATEAVVLRTWPTGETSVIASFATARHGFVRVIAKGARAERSALRPLVQPGRLIDVEFSLNPDRELQYLKAGTVLQDPFGGSTSLERTAYLLAAVELADRCRPGGDRDLDVFDLCRGFLQVLSSTTPGDAGLFYAFELRLLDLHGTAPATGSCAHCGRDAADGGNGARWCPDAGGAVCRVCSAEGHGRGGRALSGGALAAMRALVAGSDDAATLIDGDRALRREVGVHLHRFLQYHVPTYRLPSALDLLRPRRDGASGETGTDGRKDDPT